MNTIALLREIPDPTDDEIRSFLAGNLCRCSGYEGQTAGQSAAIWKAAGKKETAAMEHKEYHSINKPVRKKDAMQLLLGKPVYTDDVTPRDALVVKILRSPHANAMVEEIETAGALKIPGVVAILHLEGCAPEPLYQCGPDLPRALPL